MPFQNNIRSSHKSSGDTDTPEPSPPPPPPPCTLGLYIYLASENLAFHVPPTEVTRPCQYIEPAPADGGTLSGEKERFERYLNEIQTRCERVESLGKPKTENAQKSQDLNANSYICLGGKMGLQRRNCLVIPRGYSPGRNS